MDLRSSPFDPGAVAAFHQRGWDYDEATGVARHRYDVDGLRFEERFTFPSPAAIECDAAFVRAMDVLHVAAGVSYYKAAAPPVVTGLPAWAVPFAAALYADGLAEFAMANDLPIIQPRFESSGEVTAPPVDLHGPPRALVAVGGGKDSIVAIESARRRGRPFALASVGTHRAIEETARISRSDHLVIGRAIDPALLALNDRGARNGHVPVTAINSSALAVLAAGLGYDAVVMANEASASVPITSYRGRPVNHQWSKSLECERALAALLPVRYFSLLRPLNEIEICRRFAPLDQYFGTVTSCNHAYTAAGRSAGVRWCGRCPKCRFVFLGMAPFLPPDAVIGMFDGFDLLSDPQAVEPYRAILGLGGDPPLECVGTTRESRWAMAQLASSPGWSPRPVVRALAALVTDVDGWDPTAERGDHAVPADWVGALDALA